MSSPKKHYPSLDHARNAAIKWLQDRGVRFNGNHDITVGDLETCEAFYGKETGVAKPTGAPGKFWRLRIDHDLVHGLHFNAEYGKGRRLLDGTRVPGATEHFCFPGDAHTLRRLANRRTPRNLRNS